jgi:hypothetical protein
VGLACLALAGAPSGAVSAPEGGRYALIVAGASGGPPYSEQHARWAEALRRTLVEQMRFDPERIVALGDTADERGVSTAANVRQAVSALRARVQPQDLLVIVLIGHGTFDGMDAKFNLVGPDLDSSEWAALLDPVRGRAVVVNTTAASFPFLERLSRRGRIVITATDSAAQRFDTVFPEYFIGAFADEAADIDKNGRVSIWEAFAAAASGVRRHYQQRGQLATERALLDDNGDGLGREAAAQGEDGALARRTYLDRAAAGAPPTDDVLIELLHRQASLLAEVEELQVKKAFLSATEYAREFERVMIALARVSRDIRVRSGS